MVYGEDTYSKRDKRRETRQQRERQRSDSEDSFRQKPRRDTRLQAGSNVVPYEQRDSTFKAIGRVEIIVNRIAAELAEVRALSRIDKKREYPPSRSDIIDTIPTDKVVQKHPTEDEA